MRYHGWLKASVALLSVALLVTILNARGLRWSDLTPSSIRTYVLSFGWSAPLVYVLLYSQPLIPLPSSVMLMAAGLAFGMTLGLPLALTGLIIRGCSQFLLARWCGREAIESLLRGRLAALDHSIGALTFQAIVWMRILLPVPYDMVNVSFGISPVSFRVFALATIVSAIPGGLLWVYLGYTVTEAHHLWKVGVSVTGLLALWFIQRSAQSRRARTPESSPYSATSSS